MWSHIQHFPQAIIFLFCEKKKKKERIKIQLRNINEYKKGGMGLFIYWTFFSVSTTVPKNLIEFQQISRTHSEIIFETSSNHKYIYKLVGRSKVIPFAAGS